MKTEIFEIVLSNSAYKRGQKSQKSALYNIVYIYIFFNPYITPPLLAQFDREFAFGHMLDFFCPLLKAQYE